MLASSCTLHNVRSSHSSLCIHHSTHLHFRAWTGVDERQHAAREGNGCFCGTPRSLRSRLGALLLPHGQLWVLLGLSARRPVRLVGCVSPAICVHVFVCTAEKAV